MIKLLVPLIMVSSTCLLFILASIKSRYFGAAFFFFICGWFSTALLYDMSIRMERGDLKDEIMLAWRQNKISTEALNKVMSIPYPRNILPNLIFTADYDTAFFRSVLEKGRKTMANSSKKGFGYERKIAKALSIWYTDGRDDDIFWRTQGSGGRATQRAKKGKKTKYNYGDLTFTNPIGKPFIDYFLVEIKKGYNQLYGVMELLSKKKESTLLKWWDKAESERKLGERKQVLLILGKDRQIPCVLVSHDFFLHIYNFFRLDELDHVIINLKHKKLVMFRMPDFFDLIDPEWFTYEQTAIR